MAIIIDDIECFFIAMTCYAIINEYLCVFIFRVRLCHSSCVRVSSDVYRLVALTASY